MAVLLFQWITAFKLIQCSVKMTFLGLFVNNLFKYFDLLLKAIQVPLNSQTTNYFQKIYGGESLWCVRPCNVIIWQEKLVLEFCVNFKQCLPEKERMKRKKERKDGLGGYRWPAFLLLLWTTLVVKEISMLLLCSLTLHSIIIII